MKRRKLLYYLSMFLLLTVVGCKDDVIGPESSIEERINVQKPLEIVQIHNYDILDVHLYLSKDNSDRSRKIEKAYADDNYLIVVTPYKKYNFNLSTAKSIEVEEHRVDLHY